MTSTQKVIKYCSLAFAIFLIVSIISGLIFLLAVSLGVVWFKGISSILIIVLVISLIFLHKRRPSKLIERVGMIR